MNHQKEPCHKCGGTVKFTDDSPSFLYCQSCGTTNPVRPTWSQTWMKIAHVIAERSYDPRLKVGAIIVSEDNSQMLSEGYNGNYKGGPHVHESTNPGQSGFLHAEANALVKCDFNFHKKKHMYVTHMPCRQCAKMIINAEISRIVYDVPYRDPSGVELLKSVGVEVLCIAEAILKSQ
jgi:dCMP deaminase